MAVKLRLARTGKKKAVSYRIVAADSRRHRDGKFLNVVGNYNPRTNPPTIEVKEELVKQYLENGAIPTETVISLLRTKGIMQEFNAKKANKKSTKKA